MITYCRVSNTCNDTSVTAASPAVPEKEKPATTEVKESENVNGVQKMEH